MDPKIFFVLAISLCSVAIFDAECKYPHKNDENGDYDAFGLSWLIDVFGGTNPEDNSLPSPAQCRNYCAAHDFQDFVYESDVANYTCICTSPRNETQATEITSESVEITEVTSEATFVTDEYDVQNDTGVLQPLW
ncbi:uncharacterized protein LOC135398319 [Ornithodoros turicata]|uniref:uncharacterized protein LOC135398319 n=1 Tax=Ornithodoros turicata TaxID=34597 RepID=UPI003139729F